MALELMRQRAMRDTERRLAGDVLAEALTGRLRRRASWPCGCGRSASATRAAVLVFASRDPSAAERSSTASCGRPASARSSRAASALLCAVVDARGLDPVELAAQRARGARRRARRRARGGQPRGASPSAAPQLPRGALRARGRPRWPTAAAPEVASYRDLGAFQLLLSLQDDEALRLYCDSVLGPLEDGGGEYGDELLRSLEAFIEQNGQWERAARELFCHRHTLRYRIRRVEELTGRDLRAPRDRIEFWLALRGAGAGR